MGGAVLGLLILIGALVSLSLGPVHIPLSHVASIVLAFVGFDAGEFTRTEQLVIEQIRLPRIVVGASVGMALGVAGATMQGLFRNPMADPGIIGVSTGGAVGAVVAIATGATGLFFLALPTFAFVGALVATFLVYGIAAVGGHFSMATLLLAGVAVNAFLGAIVSAIIILLPDNGALREILFWLAGGLDSRSWEHVRISGAAHPGCRRRDRADVARPQPADARRRRGALNGRARGQSRGRRCWSRRRWRRAPLLR